MSQIPASLAVTVPYPVLARVSVMVMVPKLGRVAKLPLPNEMASMTHSALISHSGLGDS